MEKLAATCAGAYQSSEILSTERDMAMALGWTLKFVSPSTWSALFLQRAIQLCDTLPTIQRQLLNSDRFLRLMEIVDHSRLHMESLRFVKYLTQNGNLLLILCKQACAIYAGGSVALLCIR